MFNLGEFCKECVCAKCVDRECCGTIKDNTDSYCKDICKGEKRSIKFCSQFIKED